MPNGAVFETIVQRIRQSDFCVFDDRETEVRPNVLIELGVAIGIGKPYFYLNYQKKRKVAIARRREVITTASDLAGMLYIPYTSYEDVVWNSRCGCPGSSSIGSSCSNPDRIAHCRRPLRSKRYPIRAA